MNITYEIYLDCLRIGLKPNPKKIATSNDICPGIQCDSCPVHNTQNDCSSSYLTASEKFYPKMLTQNPEYLL